MQVLYLLLLLLLLLNAIRPEDVIRCISSRDKLGLWVMWGYADDIVIYGKSEKEHDEHMLKMITRCNTNGLKLNHDKWRIKQRKIKFYIESLLVQMEFRDT